VIAPYVALAKVVSIVAPMGLTFLVGFRVSDERAALANLKSQLAAVEQDRGNARKAAADAALRGAAIEANAAVEKESTDAYIRDLESRPNTACALTDDDLRGMRAIRPGDAGSRPSGKAGLHGAGRGAGAAAR
jgi:hypothetical protein